MKSENALFEASELVLNAFECGISLLKSNQGERRKMLTLRQMLQRLAIPLVKIKAGNTL